MIGLDDKSHHVWAALGLSLGAGLLVWWASRVLEEGQILAGSTFQFPTGHIAGSQVLLAAAGVCFAFVFSLNESRVRQHSRHLLIAGIPPLTAIVIVWIWVSPISLPFSLITVFVSNEVTILAPFLVGLLYGLAVLRRRKH